MIKTLDYDKENEFALFKELCGTCSTKHTLLRNWLMKMEVMSWIC